VNAAEELHELRGEVALQREYGVYLGQQIKKLKRQRDKARKQRDQMSVYSTSSRVVQLSLMSLDDGRLISSQYVALKPGEATTVNIRAHVRPENLVSSLPKCVAECVEHRAHLWDGTPIRALALEGYFVTTELLVKVMT